MSECADFTVIHVLKIVTSKPSAVNRANLYWKFGRAAPDVLSLTSSDWNRALASNDTVATAKTRPGLSFLSHLPTANFQSFTLFLIKWCSRSWVYWVNMFLTTAQSLTLLHWSMCIFLLWGCEDLTRVNISSRVKYVSSPASLGYIWWSWKS